MNFARPLALREARKEPNQFETYCSGLIKTEAKTDQVTYLDNLLTNDELARNLG